MLNEKEQNIVNYLRFPMAYVSRKEVVSTVKLSEITLDELNSLYEKMDDYITYEGQQRRSLGLYDEIYIIELLNVKDRLKKEIDERTISRE